jgi:hypothetical protein
VSWLNKLSPGQRIKDGLRGQAVVLSINQYVDQSSSARMPIRLMVHLEGREPYSVKHTCFVPRKKYPFPGTSLPVTVDRDDPERIRIEWDDVQTADERMDQRYGRSGETGGATGGPLEGIAAGQVIDVRGDPALREQVLEALGQQGQGAGAPADPLDRLKKLTELRDAGALTPEEFETQKKKILGE